MLLVFIHVNDGSYISVLGRWWHVLQQTPKPIIRVRDETVMMDEKCGICLYCNENDIGWGHVRLGTLRCVTESRGYPPETIGWRKFSLRVTKDVQTSNSKRM